MSLDLRPEYLRGADGKVWITIEQEELSSHDVKTPELTGTNTSNTTIDDGLVKETASKARDSGGGHYEKETIRGSAMGKITHTTAGSQSPDTGNKSPNNDSPLVSDKDILTDMKGENNTHGVSHSDKLTNDSVIGDMNVKVGKPPHQQKSATPLTWLEKIGHGYQQTQ